MDKKYTIKDIAEMAGVSFKTVSRVINNEPNVRPETRRKVLQVIEQTHFKPNVFAKNLQSKSVKNILISIRKAHGQNTTQWFDVLMSHLMRLAGSRSYNLIYEVVYDDSELEHSMMERLGGFIDVVILFYLKDNDKRIELARRSGIPHLSFEKNRSVRVSVSNNNRKGVEEVARFLFERGLTRICFMLGAEIEVNLERAEAMRQAYRQHGIPPERLETVFYMNNLENIHRFVTGKIGSKELPEVFFVSGDEKAIAVYSALQEQGLRIPEDVSVIGFDNIPISRYYSPPLTTMGQDFERLALELFATVDKMMNREEGIAPVEVDPRLIVRQSVR
ncbi:LacI family DNA-binding transcriptional regulator [Paenibacillus hamazuiensis]|uniref:LacI family DNA-binding transcriptional regulator n=1 Tax=Paenibacillus hamazuiensis TaxID=2936508 RepID=UPI00200E61FE|nr:LacI family DNA-binding transcriptional regulator [Paenibacillus hamazuiensis]